MKITPDYSQVIQGLHPAVAERMYTYDDALRMSILTGVEPQALVGVLVGCVLPHEFMIDALKSMLGEDTVQQMVDDYDPTRNYLIIPQDKVRPHVDKIDIYEFYSAALMEPYDCVKMNTDDWMVITDIKTDDKKYVMYSGLVSAFVCDIKDTLICSPNLYHVVTKNRIDFPDPTNTTQDVALSGDDIMKSDAKHRAALLRDIKKSVEKSKRYFVPSEQTKYHEKKDQEKQRRQ